MKWPVRIIMEAASAATSASRLMPISITPLSAIVRAASVSARRWPLRRVKFTLLSGEDKLSEYLFNKHKIHHLFCSTCGIESFAYADGPDGTPMVAVNANCLDGVDPRGLKPQVFDGAAA